LYFVTQFISGLKPELAATVQSQVPKKMKKAIQLAKVQQQLLDSKHFKSNKYNVKFNAMVPEWDNKKSGTPTTPSENLWRERQLRDFRRANGLCMYCGDKFDKAHAGSCTKRPQPQANALVLNELDQPLTEEVLNQLEIEDAITEVFGQLSISAISGTAHDEVLRLKVMVKTKVMLVLLDSGSSHSFTSSAFLFQVGLTDVSTQPKQVKVANRETLLTDKMIPQLSWWCQ
jgi:hypothetical protein